MEEWNNLGWIGFPAYSVSTEGDIRNDETLRRLAQSVTKSGVRKVSLNDNENKRRTLGVAHLVASNFVEGETTTFDTVINLNGDRSDNRAVNLSWRPRWFAVAYHKQFSRAIAVRQLMCIEKEEVFSSPRAAAQHYGLLEIEIMQSCYRNQHEAYRGSSGVWPYDYNFVWVEEV